MTDCLVIVGEPSGEEHARSFLPALMQRLPHTHFWGVGGDEMKSWGVDLTYHLKDFSSMGLSEVLQKIFFYLSARKKILLQCQEHNTKVAILVDFQGFNLSLVKHLKLLNIKIIYYVAPQAWAWKPWRAKVLAQYVSQLYCILPFEAQWFRSRGVRQSIAIPHPLFKQVTAFLKNAEKRNRKYLLLLPGSRNTEVKYILPIMIQAIKKLQQAGIKLLPLAIVKSPNVSEKYYAWFRHEWEREFKASELHEALNQSMLAIAASGTVTLSCALMQVPTIVCYKVNLLNEWFFHTFIQYQGYVSLPNIILGREVFPELIQENCQGEIIASVLKKWLTQEKIRLEIEDCLAELYAHQVGLQQQEAELMLPLFLKLTTEPISNNKM